jgi:hypothetical protein
VQESAKLGAFPDKGNLNALADNLAGQLNSPVPGAPKDSWDTQNG